VPAETDIRFKLLKVVAVVLSATLGFLLTTILASYQIISPPLQLSGTFRPGTNIHENIIAYVSLIGSGLPWLVLPVLLALLVLLLSYLIYWTHPARIRRQKQLIRLAPGQDEELINTVRALEASHNLQPPVTIEIDTRHSSTDSQAFGLQKHPALRLGGRMRLLLRKAPDQFKAIILHELAHFANGDVHRVYSALATWSALLFMVLIPLIFYAILQAATRALQAVRGAEGISFFSLFTQIFPRTGLIIFQTMVLILLTSAILTSAVRVRELYADWRAALWGARDLLINIFLKEVKVPIGKHRWGWAMHPTSQERLSNLKNPALLFDLSLDLPFFTGFLLAFLLAYIKQIGPLVWLVLRGTVELFIIPLKLIYTYQDSVIGNFILSVIQAVSLITPAVLALLTAMMLAGVLGTGTLGTQVCRQSLFQIAHKESGMKVYLRTALPALVFSSGIQLGFIVTPGSPLTPLHYSLRSFWILIALAPIWVIISGLMTWIWLGTGKFYTQQVLAASTSQVQFNQRFKWYQAAMSAILGVLLLAGMLGQMVFADLAMDPSYQTLPWILFPISMAVAVFTSLLAAAVTWAVGMFLRRAGQLKCLSCGRIQDKPGAVGHKCDQCGNELAGWLFTE
jgi:Zn-dependent protease with chaperone function